MTNTLKKSDAHDSPLYIWLKKMRYTLPVAASKFGVSRNTFVEWLYRMDVPRITSLVKMEEIIGRGAALKFVKYKIEKFQRLSLTKKNQETT